MKYLIQNATIVDPGNPLDGKTTDVLIENGKIISVKSGIKDKDATVISLENLHLSPGWMDLCANFRDPGFEYKETLESGAAAAVRGGFTHVVVMPGTNPVISGKTQVEYIINRGRTLPVHLLPCGSLSSGFDGENISEMFDMHQAGAVAFSDYKKPVQAGLMSRALMYAKNFGGKIFSFPYEPTLAPGGMMNEGKQSTLLGLKGIPEISESVAVMRDIKLAGFNESGIHFIAVSSEDSLLQIEKANTEGMSVTAQIAAHQVYFTDESLEEFDTNLKVLPPLRNAKTNRVLIHAIKNGLINCIVSDHSPEDTESKKLEFDHAEFGIIGMETAFSSVRYATANEVELSKLIGCFTHGPRSVLGLERLSIEEGADASLTLFDPDQEWIFSEKDICSRSRNSPFIGKPMKGKVYGIFSKNEWRIA